MSADFVAACRREWKRLGVAPGVAEQMAAELQSDLDEAAADGVPSRELVGDEPRAFAASWAAARGVVAAKRSRTRVWALAGATAVGTALAITGVVLLATKTASTKQALVPTSPIATTITLSPVTGHAVAGRSVQVSSSSVWYSKGATTTIAAIPGATTHSAARTAGLILLSVGLLALILAACSSLRPVLRA